MREFARDRIRREIGVRGPPPPICVDESAFLAVDAAPRTIHGDLPSMLIGGIASLLLQMLHPLAMSGVAQHSRYREDPLGRLARTAEFVRATTYGSRAEAETALDRVRRVHVRVQGTAESGEPYSALDPHLVEWVHIAEISMFLAAARAYGPTPIDDALADRYVADMAIVAEELGVANPPRSLDELDRRMDAFRGELALIDEGREARDFVLLGVSRSPQRRFVHHALARGAVGVLPAWAREGLELPFSGIEHALVERPRAMTLCVALRFAVPPLAQETSVSPPSTAIT
jgi:uncharacterized protein (DUF2236 family)